jgi:hypothetical protein
MIETMLGLIFLLAAMYLWQNALRARDLARALGHDLCAKAGVQLLDQSVSLSGVGFTRNGQGQLRLRRSYAFEVSLDGHDRHRGGLTMLDNRLLSWSLPITQAPATVPESTLSGTNVIAMRRPQAPTSLH